MATERSVHLGDGRYLRRDESYSLSRTAIPSGNWIDNAEATGANNSKSVSCNASAALASPSRYLYLPTMGWSGLDMTNATIRNLSPVVYRYTFLTQLRLADNNLTTLTPGISQLKSLVVLDVSGNRLRAIPAELGTCVQLRELFLYNNQISLLPYELGMLFQLDLLSLDNNPITEPWWPTMKDSDTRTIVQYLRENAPVPPPPPERSWVQVAQNFNEQAAFTVFCMNILCDKFASPQLYGYCPSWALTWDFRKDLILQEILQQNADIVCLQEVETAQFYDYFQPELSRLGQYKGIFRAKSRSKTMSDEDARNVDGCAIFHKPSKFAFVTETCFEFQQASVRPELRSHTDFYNRIMPKDNIALIAILRHLSTNETLVVANPHMTWDPQYADVKLVQTALLMDELYRALRRGVFGSRELLPMIICGDFNSLPTSPVYQFLAKGHLPKSSHSDFNGRNYGPYTDEELQHRFNLASAYSRIGELPFTNKTPGFTGTIDYIWHTTDRLSIVGLLGAMNQDYCNKHPGFPNQHCPSDHIALVSEFVFVQAPPTNSETAATSTGSRATYSTFTNKP